MAIKFSPGCPCCGYQYIAFVHILSLGGASGGQGSMSMATENHFGGAVDPFGFGEGVYCALVSTFDLQTDCKLNVFTPDGLGLPIPASAQVFTYGSLLPPPVSPQFAIPNKVVLFASAPLPATCEFGLFLLRGSKGAWEIVGGTVKLQQTSAIQGKTATFTIDADGSIQ